jgi:hypothetical protein
MTEQTASTSPPSPALALRVDYLFRELEFQVAIETHARDRMETMMQYLLTTIAGVIGAVLVVSRLQVDSKLVLLIAALLIFGFSTSAFYRSCRLRYITTYARVTRNKIRCALVSLGVAEADDLIQWEGNPSGFDKRMLAKLVPLGILCSLLGGVCGVISLLLLFHIQDIAQINGLQAAGLIGSFFILSGCTGLALRRVLRSQKAKSEELITEAAWLQLPDYDL